MESAASIRDFGLIAQFVKKGMRDTVIETVRSLNLEIPTSIDDLEHKVEFVEGKDYTIDYNKPWSVYMPYLTFPGKKKATFCPSLNRMSCAKSSNHICLLCLKLPRKTVSDCFFLFDASNESSHAYMHLEQVHNKWINRVRNSSRGENLRIPEAELQSIKNIIIENRPISLLSNKYYLKRCLRKLFHDQISLVSKEVNKDTFLGFYSDGVKLPKNNGEAFGISFVTSDWKFVILPFAFVTSITGSKAEEISRIASLKLSATFGSFVKERIFFGMSDTTASAVAVSRELALLSPIPCIWHLLGLTLGYSIGLKSWQVNGKKFYSPFKSLLDSLNSLKSYFTQSPQASNCLEIDAASINISGDLKLEDMLEIKPRTVISAIQKFIRLFPAITLYFSKFAPEKNVLEYLQQLDINLLSEILALLQPFDKLMSALQTHYRPGFGVFLLIRLVLLNDYNMLNSVTFQKTDWELYKRMKLSSNITRLSTIEDKYAAPPTLEATMSNFSKRGQDFGATLLQYAKEYFVTSKYSPIQMKSFKISAAIDPVVCCILKKLDNQEYENCIQELFLCAQDEFAIPTESSIMEMKIYQQEIDYFTSIIKIPKLTPMSTFAHDVLVDKECCPLVFWSRIETNLPNFSRIARKYLSCSPSNMVLENFFATAKHILSEKRSRFSNETLEKLALIKFNDRALMNVL